MKNKCWLLTLFVCVTGALWGHNVIPNPSFENGTVVPDGDFVANDSNTESWNGGILTTGGNRTFCTPGVPHGSYAMALHKQYPQISVRFHVAVGGVYDLSFFCVSRSMSKESDRCGMTVAVRIDGSSQPVVSVCPTSCTQWDRCRGTVALTAGEHVLEFTGTLNPDAKDPSTVLDEICLDLRGQNVISNHSFENGTFLGPDAERENDPSSPVTQDWMGGLICVGRGRSLASCLPPMADGEFGLSLSMDALACQAASNRFSVVEGGLYRLSLLCLQGSGTKDTPALPVAVFFDDASEPVAVCVPDSESVWKTCVAEVALDAGEHVLRLAAAPSAGDSFRRTTLDFVSLVREERQNIVPNPSFEDMAEGETCSDFRENDKAPYVIRAWQGGIATAGGGKTFCDPQMADGKIGLAIHKSYNRAEAKIHVEQGGTHVLSFSYVSRKQSQQCGMRVGVSFDGADEPVVSVLPESAEEWAMCRTLVQLKPGDHTIRFEGSLEHGFSDSSTVIDDVVLSPDNFGLFECAEGLPARLYDDVENSRGVFVDENDVVTLKARRLFSGGGGRLCGDGCRREDFFDQSAVGRRDVLRHAG